MAIALDLEVSELGYSIEKGQQPKSSLKVPSSLKHFTYFQMFLLLCAVESSYFSLVSLIFWLGVPGMSMWLSRIQGRMLNDLITKMEQKRLCILVHWSSKKIGDFID